MRRNAWRIAVAALGLVVLMAGALGFGMGAADERRVRAFGDAVVRWQQDPDYRAVAHEYVTLGVEAMQARVCGLSAGNLIMAFRSIPGLPEHLAVSDTSAAHYEAFSRGELSAYLHLASEQGVADGIGMVEQLAQRDPLTDEHIVAFLAGFKLPVATVTDAGAIAGVRRLLADVDATKPLLVRGDVATSLHSCVEGTLTTMTRAEQASAFATFDAHVRATDPQLWRSKQVSDFLAGIWAQGYGQVYLDGISGFFRVRSIARTVLVAATAGLIFATWKARGRGTRKSAVASDVSNLADAPTA